VAITINTSLIRIVLAALLVIALSFVSLRRPQSAALLTLLFLPLLALTRRLLIPVAGWTSWDGLLLVAPVVSIVLTHRLFVVKKHPLARDVVSKLVFAILVLALIETVNPAGGNLRAGITGLLFLGAPLLWFFIGRGLADQQLVKTLFLSVSFVGVAVAIYGLWQTQVGLPSWDASWVALNGYPALNVLGATRSFGTFSSGAEYAAFLGIALVAALFAGRRRLVALPILGVLACALFLESSRGVFIEVLLAVVVVLVMRTGSMRLTLLATLVAAGVAGTTIHFFGPQLTTIALNSGNPLVVHQVAGLMNPLDTNQSTYLGHQEMALNGVVASVDHPLGLGTAATNLAGQRLAGISVGTEVDLSNAFVSLGLVGGLLFLALMVATLWRAGSLALSSRNPVALATMGVLIVTLGQWLNGGYYAVAPLVWLLIGWANREWLARRETVPEAGRRSHTNRSFTTGHEAQAATW
jgi:hypothetical protein